MHSAAVKAAFCNAVGEGMERTSVRLTRITKQEVTSARHQYVPTQRELR